MRIAALVGAAGWALRAVWLALFAALVISAVVTRVGPLLGHEMFVIRGGSMSPAIAVGSVAFASHTAPGDVVVGDIATFRGTNGVVVTHRVVETIVNKGEYLFRTKGDANATADGFLVPEGALVGVVRAQVPFAGYLLAMQAQPAGLASIASALIAIYLAISLLDERKLEARPRGAGARPHGLAA